MYDYYAAADEAQTEAEEDYAHLPIVQVLQPLSPGITLTGQERRSVGHEETHSVKHKHASMHSSATFVTAVCTEQCYVRMPEAVGGIIHTFHC